MIERITLPGEIDGHGFLEMYLRECIYLNCDSGINYLPKPYEYADIQQARIDPSEVKPTAKYVLRSNLATIEALDKELSTQGIDIFNLHGVIKIDDNNYICPPILEVWKEKPYNGIPVIVDGLHRLYIARKRGIEINCVLISGEISSMLPVLPLTGWHEVVEQDAVPKDKRNYHPGIPAHWKPHELYRRRFHGSTGPRIVLSTSNT
ncbi:hypothetical protein MUP46_00500 [Patescibacteria group bacterium]|nr:hypothetical protein [Patescibacteria group bacterium]